MKRIIEGWRGRCSSWTTIPTSGGPPASCCRLTTSWWWARPRARWRPSGWRPHSEPDLVLLDMLLPDGDGLSVAETLAGLETVPAVVLTSSRDATVFGDRLATAPVRGFLPKADLSVDTLVATGRPALTGQAWYAVADLSVGIAFLLAGLLCGGVGRLRSRRRCSLSRGGSWFLGNLAGLPGIVGAVAAGATYVHRGPHPPARAHHADRSAALADRPGRRARRVRRRSRSRAGPQRGGGPGPVGRPGRGDLLPATVVRRRAARRGNRRGARGTGARATRASGGGLGCCPALVRRLPAGRRSRPRHPAAQVSGRRRG